MCVCVCVCADVYSDDNIWLFRIDLRLNPQPLLFLCFFHLPIVRHGQSIWNKDNRFTAWMDVPLSRQGLDDAGCAAMHLKPAGIRFDIAFTSVLQRAIKTCNTILEEIGQLWIPTVCDWQVPRISHKLVNVQAVERTPRRSAVGTEQEAGCRAVWT